MIYSKVRSQLLGTRPSSAPLCEGTVAWVGRRSPRPTASDKPTLTLALQRWEVALRPTTLGILRHVQRVPAEPLVHAAHG
eukprot:scaffold40739_cov49-Phaeocystis_antarctica.AAC.2